MKILSARLGAAMLFLASCLAPHAGMCAGGFSAFDLRCEYMHNPLAVNTDRPKFSWKAASDGRGFMQGAYEIVVSATEEEASRGIGTLWSSGKVESDASLHIPYGGEPLASGEEYFWSVRIYDNNGNASEWSAPARFGIGLLDGKAWHGAEWIAMEKMPERERIVPGIEYKNVELVGDRTPGANKLPQFRKEFTVGKPVRRATAYVGGIGQFCLYLNGAQVGDRFMDPPATDYDKKVCYVPFDVTRLLRDGGNAIGVMLGNGYASVPMRLYYKGLISYTYPKMILALEIEYEDGSHDRLVSDRSWRVTQSPLTYCSIFGGEAYDARLFLEGWTETGFDDSGWQKPILAALPDGARMVAAETPPMKVMQRFPPVTRRKTRHGAWLFDLGQNFQGTVRISLRGERGQTVKINTTELFNTQVDSITTCGGYRGEYRLTYTIGQSGRTESWNPQFTYFGQRYVLVTGAVPEGEENPDSLPVIEDLVGLHLRASADVTGHFDCSDELLNKTHELIEWGVKGNLTASFITDCPHREKLPWLEQLHLMFGSLQYNFELYKTFEKSADDMALAQWDNGLVPDIAPMFFMFRGWFIDSPEWGSSSILVPWKVYEHYGDRSLIERHYDTMKRYLKFLESRSEGYILDYGLGDWYDIGPKKPGVSQHTSMAATATPIFYMDAVTMARCARMLGRTEDEKEFTALAENIRNAYNKAYFHADGGYYDRNSQCANSIALCAGLVEPQNEKAVLDNIVADIRRRGNALSAGDVGYNYVLRALESRGQSQVIYDMNSRYDRFGYGNQIAHGATALPETWDSRPEKSHNHLMLGHLQEWFYSQVGGIQRDTAATAFKRIVIRPSIVGGISFARTGFMSPYGEISTDWNDSSERFRMEVTVPANTTARIYVPAAEGDTVTESGIEASKAHGVRAAGSQEGYRIFETGSGTYRFEVDKR